MDTTDQNRAIALVPQDDGAIDHAINDLDAKIATWVEAMQKASSALAQVARAESTAPKRPEVAAPSLPASKQQGVPVETESATSAQTVVALPGGKKRDVPQPTPDDPGKSPSGLGAKLRKLVGGTEAEGAEKETVEPEAKAVGVTNPVESAKPVSAEKTKQELEAEEEALLAQLDPKVAKSIRIKRRLSRGKKTVRELLNESNK